jgi:hypothetical protein
MNNQISFAINKKHTYESLKEIFQKWANPEEEEDNTPIASTDDEDETPSDLPWEKKEEKASPYTLQTKQPKADKFNDLFDKE